MNRKSRIAAAIALAMALSAPALADDSKEFVTKAAIAGNFEIESSKLALERSKNDGVRKFAQMMIDDHTAASAKMKEAMAADKIDASAAPDALDEKHQKKLNDLREKADDKFDEAYMDEQKAAHKDAVDLFEEFADDGDTPALKTFAAETVARLKMHHEESKRIESKVD